MNRLFENARTFKQRELLWFEGWAVGWRAASGRRTGECAATHDRPRAQRQGFSHHREAVADGGQGIGAGLVADTQRTVREGRRDTICKDPGAQGEVQPRSFKRFQTIWDCLELRLEPFGTACCAAMATPQPAQLDVAVSDGRTSSGRHCRCRSPGCTLLLQHSRTCLPPPCIWPGPGAVPQPRGHGLGAMRS